MTTALAARMFRPSRPNLDAARAVIAGERDPSAAWLKLASQGLIPSSFTDGSRRFAFSADPAPAQLTQEVQSGRLFDHPPTMEAVLTLAADPDGMLAAERALGELLARLEPWNAELPSKKYWMAAPADHPHAATLNGAYVIALDALEASLGESGVPLAQWMPPEEAGLPNIAARALAADTGWRFAVEKSLRISRSCWPPQRLAEQPFASVPNPFEALIELWMTGYVLDAGVEREEVWLVAPLV
jgi:hypothetical protein